MILKGGEAVRYFAKPDPAKAAKVAAGGGAPASLAGACADADEAFRRRWGNEVKHAVRHIHFVGIGEIGRASGRDSVYGRG